jgi:hypothetical protein
MPARRIKYIRQSGRKTLSLAAPNRIDNSIRSIPAELRRSHEKRFVRWALTFAQARPERSNISKA